MFSNTFEFETAIKCFQMLLLCIPFSFGQCIYYLLYSLDHVSNVFIVSVWFLFGLLLWKGVANKVNTLVIKSLQKCF